MHRKDFIEEGKERDSFVARNSNDRLEKNLKNHADTFCLLLVPKQCNATPKKTTIMYRSALYRWKECTCMSSDA